MHNNSDDLEVEMEKLKPFFENFAREQEETASHYMDKLSDDCLRKMVIELKGNHICAEEMTELRKKIRSSLLDIVTSSSTYVLEKQAKGLLVKLENNLMAIQRTFAALYPSRHKPIKVNSSEMTDGWAGKVLLDAMRQKIVQKGGFDNSYPPETLTMLNSASSHTWCFQEQYLAKFEDAIDWMLKVTCEAKESIKPQRGQPKNAFAESLIIPLANSFYELTGKPPRASFSGTKKMPVGLVLKFIAPVLNAFGLD